MAEKQDNAAPANPLLPPPPPPSSPSPFSKARAAAAARMRLAAACLVVLPALWWHPLLLGWLPDFMDTVTNLYPIRMAAARQIASGVPPTWLPNVFSGVPLAANPQVALWYPPQLLFYLSPGPFSFGLLCVLHYAWGGLGVFFLVRRLTRAASVAPALFAALVFQFGSMLVSRIALTPHLYTAVWIPWMLLAVEQTLGARHPFARSSGAPRLVLFAAMQTLAGSPQITFYTFLAVPLYWLWRALEKAPSDGGRLRYLAWQLLGALASFSLALLLAGAQLAPMAALAGDFSRGPIAAALLAGQALNGSFVWRALVGFTGPRIEDTDSINAIGLGAILLAVYALLAGKRARRQALPFLGLGLLFWLLSLGVLADFWSRVLPPYRYFHAPRRALILWSALGPAAAGIGAAALAAAWRRRAWPRPLYYLALAALFIGTPWMLPRLERAFADPQRLQPDARYPAQIGQARYFTIDPTLRYSYDSRREDFGLSMLPNLACLSGAHDAQGYDPLVLKNYAVARNFASRGSGVFYPSHGAFFTDPNSPVLGLLGVQYLIGRYDLFEPGAAVPGASIDAKRLQARLTLKIDHPRWPLWRYRDERPLAWSAARLAMAENDAQALAAAVSQPDLYSTAFVGEPAPAIPLDAKPPRVEQARWLDARTIEVRLETPPVSGAFVCLAVPWVNGWIAVDDRANRLEVSQANGLNAAVTAIAGTRWFILRYAPAYYSTGITLSFGGVLLLFAFFLHVRGKPPARRP